MEFYFQLVKDEATLREACETLSKSEFLGFDTETTELDPYDGELRLVQLSDGKDTKVVDLREYKGDLQPLFDVLTNPKITKIAHNAKFDAKWVKHHLKIEVESLFDTLLASQLIAAGDQDRRHNLAEVTSFFLNQELDKTEQKSDWSGELSHSQIEYAAKDAATMIPLHARIAEKLQADGLENVAKLENECVNPVAVMELNGIYLDRERWTEQLEKVKKEQAKLADQLQDMLSAGVAQASLFGRAEINLDSQSQVSDALKNLGVPVPETTRGWQLQPLADKYPVVAKLLEYRSVGKNLTSFGENILEFIKPQTNRLHSDFRQIGAPTGRFSSSKPNLQQIPHSEEYRRAFRASEGKKLVIADYSQIELRILADFSNDENFIKAFESGADFHSITASQVFGVSPENVTSEQRSFAKRLNFGVVYGIGASRFAQMTGVSQSQAEDTMRRYFATYRGLDDYLRKSAQKVTQDKWSRTGSGRLIRFRFDETDRSAIGSARRVGMNFPIQGTSADILKRTLRLLHDGLKTTSGKLVNIVHDEILVEADANEAENIAQILENAMVSAGKEFVKKVPIKVDLKISDEWSK
jgi:DNA polymerase I-like protein with 3'-5' exonuclease and polymerase domains